MGEQGQSTALQGLVVRLVHCTDTVTLCKPESLSATAGAIPPAGVVESAISYKIGRKWNLQIQDELAAVGKGFA